MEDNSGFGWLFTSRKFPTSGAISMGDGVGVKLILISSRSSFVMLAVLSV